MDKLSVSCALDQKHLNYWKSVSGSYVLPCCQYDRYVRPIIFTWQEDQSSLSGKLYSLTTANADEETALVTVFSRGWSHIDYDYLYPLFLPKAFYIL